SPPAAEINKQLGIASLFPSFDRQLFALIILKRMGIGASSPWLKSLKGKHVLITGGSSGIGFAIAKEALSQGAFITILARSSSKLEKAAQILAP
ncbi:hypothetical protein KI387_028313, partial [Taxus chinensis]